MRKTTKFIFLILGIWVALSALSTVNAATATIKANKTSATVGDSVKVTVSVNAAAWNLQVSGATSGSIIGYNADAENQATTKEYTIDTSKAGTYTVSLSGDVTDEAKEVADTISTSVTITVKEKQATTDVNKDTSDKGNTSTTDKNTSISTDKKEETTPEKPKEKSNNANLSTLGVTPKEYDFSGFSKNKTTYNVTVPKNVDSLKVLYKTADANATVKVSGNSGFKVGSDNKITIKVTAEDGKTTKTYTIKVTQLAEEEEKPGNLLDEDNTGLYLTKLIIKGIELSPEFEKDTYSYTAKLTDSTLNELKVDATANNEKAKIDISGNTDLVEGENTINILLTLDESSVQTVYQIVVTKEGVQEEPILTIGESTPTSSSTDLIGTIKSYIGIAIAVIVFVIVVVIVLIILLRRENNRLREENDNDIEEEKSEEYNVYKNDENEFVNNDIQKDNFIESLYKQRNANFNNEELNEQEKETLEEISKQTEEIFREKVAGQSVEYSSKEFYAENPLEERKRRRGKGKHSL